MLTKKLMKEKIVVSLVLAILIGLLCTVYFIFMRGANSTPPKNRCKGLARCFYGTIEKVVDGDTLQISGETVRLALINTPEKWEEGYEVAGEFVEKMCPIGSIVIVDEDDLQTSRSHRRIVAVVYCDSKNLNKELLKTGHAKILKDFCKHSEFANEEWAKLNGCG